MADFILRETRGAVAVITLNRPEILNAWHMKMRAALVEALAAHQALGESIRLYAEGCIRDGVVDRADDAHMAVALPNQRH